jgi:hypothetical protein
MSMCFQESAGGSSKPKCASQSEAILMDSMWELAIIVIVMVLGFVLINLLGFA